MTGWGAQLREGYLYGLVDGRAAGEPTSWGEVIELLTSRPARFTFADELSKLSWLEIQSIGVKPAAEKAVVAALERILIGDVPQVRGRGRPADVLAYIDGFEAGQRSWEEPGWRGRTGCRPAGRSSPAVTPAGLSPFTG